MLLISAGPANTSQTDCMGRYKKVNGFMLEHKPVWKHEKSGKFLCSVDNQWMVSYIVVGFLCLKKTVVQKWSKNRKLFLRS